MPDIAKVQEAINLIQQGLDILRDAGYVEEEQVTGDMGQGSNAGMIEDDMMPRPVGKQRTTVADLLRSRR